MAASADVVEVDGTQFSVQFDGFDAPMEVQTSMGVEVCFRSWTFRSHFRALEAAIFPTRQGLRLHPRHFAQQVLSGLRVPAAVQEELAPLALWWAAGGEQPQCAERLADSWIKLGARRFRLRAWTGGERLEALSKNYGKDEHGAPVFNIAAYLEAMVRASVVEINPSLDLDQLDSATTAGLMDAVVAANVVNAQSGSIVPWSEGKDQTQLARSTLRLCRALGWTPSQVWTTPAPEIDRLLVMLDMVEPEAKVSQKRTGMAGRTDAVVINIEDD